MDPEDLKARARRIAQELLTQGDLAVAAEIFAPDCAHHAPIPMAPGPAGVRQWISALRHAFPDLYAGIEDELAGGATVVQRLTLVGTHQGSWLDLPASGRHVRWQVALILSTGPDGFFTDHWSMWDQCDLVSQLAPVAIGRTERSGA
jgi:predicted ester cyclase